jgi:16S rRNA (guanine966-N2)-methyltransferase
MVLATPAAPRAAPNKRPDQNPTAAALELTIRIVSGDLKGRRIATPDSEATRPTSDRARQAVFNILEHAAWSDGVGGLRIVDVFAGSGAMGLEALSRGAANVLFVENDRDAGEAIRHNLEAFRLEDRAKLARRDATAIGKAPDTPFDVAFLDPPYKSGLGEQALASMAAGGWLQPQALIVFERSASEALTHLDGYEVLDVRRYGAASVSFLRAKA